MKRGSQSKHANLGGLQRGATWCSFTLRKGAKNPHKHVKNLKELGKHQERGGTSGGNWVLAGRGIPEGCPRLLSLVP